MVSKGLALMRATSNCWAGAGGHSIKLTHNNAKLLRNHKGQAITFSRSSSINSIWLPDSSRSSEGIDSDAEDRHTMQRGALMIHESNTKVDAFINPHSPAK